MFITKRGLSRLIDEAVMEEIERREKARYNDMRFEDVNERIARLERYVFERIVKLENELKNEPKIHNTANAAEPE